MAGSVLVEVVVAATAQVLQVLAEHPQLMLLLPATVFLTCAAWAAAQIVCAGGQVSMDQGRNDLPEDERRELTVAAIRRSFRLPAYRSQPSSSTDTADSDDTSVL